MDARAGQEAPSAKRCIKTVSGATGRRGEGQTVRKHRAPKGALRLAAVVTASGSFLLVRKHRAPKGALRPKYEYVKHEDANNVRKHRAPKGALRLRYICHV